MRKHENLFWGIGIAILAAVAINLVEQILALPHFGYVEGAMAGACGFVAMNVFKRGSL